MDKSNGRKVLREKACQKQKQKFSSSAVYPGCGYVEVMDALVEQVMEPQSVEPLNVNIEAFVWGYNGEDKLQGMSEMLQKMGDYRKCLSACRRFADNQKGSASSAEYSTSQEVGVDDGATLWHAVSACCRYAGVAWHRRNQ